MIVVLDTNVIVSSTLSSKGNPAEIIRRWEAGEFDVATSPALIRELKEALGYEQVRKYTRATENEINSLLDRLQTIAVVFNPQITVNVIEKDPDDNRVLECAVSAGAQFIVSGNKHLLDLKEFKETVILSPASFIAVLRLEERSANL